MFSYTSGTTGDPKGVMLSHKGVLINAGGCLGRMGASIDVISEKDTCVSYLPAAHIFETIL